MQLDLNAPHRSERLTASEAEPAPAPIVTPPRSPARAIMLACAAKYGVTVGDMVSPSRRVIHVTARREAMTRIRQELRYSFPQIGRLFNRDHASVIYATRGGRPTSDVTPEQRWARAAAKAAAEGRVLGVQFRPDRDRWVAQIGDLYIGSFKTAAEAITARREAEERVWGRAVGALISAAEGAGAAAPAAVQS